MSEEKSIPFIRWGNYTSKDVNNPDHLDCEVIDVETFETEFSTNIKVSLKDKDAWNEAILPLKSHESNNKDLLNQWLRAKRENKIVPQARFMIATYMGISKNNRAIRRYDLSF